jgi:hypothetical protein
LKEELIPLLNKKRGLFRGIESLAIKFSWTTLNEDAWSYQTPAFGARVPVAAAKKEREGGRQLLLPTKNQSISLFAVHYTKTKPSE